MAGVASECLIYVDRNAGSDSNEKRSDPEHRVD
ncbi:UNVERIFIED_CONTAM: hypothetical protein ABIC26_001276 [Paenibacillus sp. PvR008]